MSFQPKPRLSDKSISDLERSEIETGQPCVLFVANASDGHGVEILLTLRELRRLARWCNWEPAKRESSLHW